MSIAIAYVKNVCRIGSRIDCFKRYAFRFRQTKI